MKVIFLDVDGVLNTNKTLYCDDSIEAHLVQNLATIVEATGAEIVLTSNWRFSHYSLTVLKDAFRYFNLTIYSEIEDQFCRATEIKLWANKHKVDKYVVLDDEDENLSARFQEKFIKIDFSKGLTREVAAKAIKLLS